FWMAAYSALPWPCGSLVVLHLLLAPRVGRRTAARPPHHQLDGEGQHRRPELRVLDLLDQGARCSDAEAEPVLADRGERRVEERRHLDVVEADDGDVAGNA